MADFNVSITMSNEPAPTDLSAGSVNNFIISNPNEGSSYFVLETVKNSNGAYDSNSPKNLEGTFSFTSGISNLVTSSYQAGVVVSPEGGTLTFTPTNAISKETLRFRGTGAGTELTSSLPAFMGLIDEYPGATAAYSLRKLSTEYTGSIIDIRRDSDDTVNSFGFTSEGILDTASIENFVNHANELPGDSGTSSPVVSYSLRKVVAAYTGSAINVRRSSDDANLDIGFDANGDLDTTALTTFVNEDVTQYNYSTATQMIADFDGVGGTNSVASVDGEEGLKFTTNASSGTHFPYRFNVFGGGGECTISFDYYLPSTNIDINGIQMNDSSNDIGVTQTTQDAWTSVTVSGTLASDNVYIFTKKGGNKSYTGNGTDVFYIKNLTVTQTTADGHVETWYDQSPGTQNKVTQTDDAKQPLIVDAGSVVLENSKPAIKFDGVDDQLTIVFGTTYSQPTFSFLVHNFTSAPSAYAGIIGSIGQEHRLIMSATLKYTIQAGGALQYNEYSTDQSLVSYKIQSSDPKVFFNGTQQSVSSGTSIGNDSSQGLILGGISLDSALSNSPVQIQELIIFDSDQSSNRLGIEANINSYYNIYTPNTTGSVPKWYDQSGNDNHATQTNETNQPLIVHTGSVILENGKPTIQFGGPTAPNHLLNDDITLSSSDSTYIIVARHQANDNVNFYDSGENDKFFLQFNNNGQNAVFDVQGTEGSIDLNYDSDSNSRQRILSMINLGDGTIESSFNGVVTKNTSSLSVVTRNGLTLGGHRDRTGTNSLDGPYQEFIYFTSSQILNRPEIELNINEAYNIFATSSAAISSPPTISGNAQSGLTLTATPSSVTGVPSPVNTFRWESSSTGTDGWSTITGQTSLTYTVQDSDLGKYLRIVQIATNGVGSPAESPSTSTDVVRTVSGAFVLRVEADGGTVENTSCGTTEVEYLLNNP